jgi:DNA-binding CsgD family transcriptional regulator
MHDLKESTFLVLRQVADGHSTKEIAENLGRSCRSIDNLVRDLRATFGARTRAHLISRAY